MPVVTLPESPFTLPDEFLLSYAAREPDWGPLGLVTYKRTYARRLSESARLSDLARRSGMVVGPETTEEWWLTVARVVEGTFRAQEWHCVGRGRPWNRAKAERAAREMYDLMWSFRFLPPGRGLWMMGTPYIWERGAAALNNCFGREVRFWTPDGPVALGDAVGGAVWVRCRDGRWRHARVESFGVQPLVNVTLSSPGRSTTVRATPDHRWVLADGSETTALTAGMVVLGASAPWTVESIVDEGHREDVFCVVEPVTHSFTLEGGIVTGNCAFITTEHVGQDFARPFAWAMDMLMLGAGVGFDVRGAGMLRIREPVARGSIYRRVADSREGWVSVVTDVLRAWSGEGPDVMPDYTDVRPAGTPLRGFGGTSAGPGPLVELVTSVRELLSGYVGRFLDSAGIVDLMTLIGRCVVAGNVRRSAELALGGADDEQFLTLKDPGTAGAAMAHHRWAANNSVMATVGMDYSRVGRQTAVNGEPGYFWLENARAYGRMADPPNNVDRDVMGVNPCGEQPLHSRLTTVKDDRGRPLLGGEMCTLVETFPARHASYAEYARTLKFAYLYAKTVTLLPTHDPATNEIMAANRRIGCSMAGVVQAMRRHGTAPFLRWCDDGYRYLGNVDAIYSDWLGIPQSIKRTSVKPGGSVPLLMGATPGMHFPESEYYWRVIRFASDSPLLDDLRAAGYRTHDLAPGEPNTTAVYFPVREQWFDRGKRDVSMWEQLELAASLQEIWADNAVSATITFDPEREGRDIPRALELYDRRLKGVSFLPTSDHGFADAPYQPITRDEYEAAVASLRPLVLGAAAHEVTERFCDGDRCEIPVGPEPGFVAVEGGRVTAESLESIRRVARDFGFRPKAITEPEN